MSKERFVVVGAHTIKDCMGDEYLDLKKSCELLNTIEKALELACGSSNFEETCDVCEYKQYIKTEQGCPCYCECEQNFMRDQAINYFKEKAKEMLKNENNNKENNS